MSDEIQTVIKKSLQDIENELKKKYKITSERTDAYLDNDNLVFVYGSAQKVPASTAETLPGVERKRKRFRKRNRMKTRGWQVVGQINNEYGQKINIYKPFVDALSKKELPKKEQLAIAKEILEANGNRPKPLSVEYFLENTLKYLDRQN